MNLLATNPMTLCFGCMAGAALCLDLEKLQGTSWTLLLCGVAFILVGTVALASAVFGWPFA